MYLLNEPPAGKSNKPLKGQIRSAADRFRRDVERSTPKVVIPMGTECFQAVTGINESILDARGYLIRRNMFKPLPREVWKQVGSYVNASKATGAKAGDPKMKWVTEAWAGPLGVSFKGVVIPAFTLDYIRTSQFAVAPAFTQDMQRVKRARDGKLIEVGKRFKFSATLDDLPDPDTLGELVAVDIETHGIDNEAIDLVSFSDGETTASIDWTEGARAYIERIFAHPTRIVAFHNSPFDLPRLVANGVRVSQEAIEHRIFDTMFGGVQAQPDLHKALGRMASLYIDLEPWKTSSRNQKSHWRAMVAADPRGYSAKDSFYTYWLANVLIDVLKDLGAWKYFMGRDGHPGPGVMATLPTLAEMSRGGLRINRDYVGTWSHKLERRLLRYFKVWFRRFPDVSPMSNPQVGKLFYKQWGLPVMRNSDDGISVDELSLLRLKAFVSENRESEDHRGAWQTDERCVPRTFDFLLRIREYFKLHSTYVKPVLLTGETWVHPSYLPASKDDERGGKKMDAKGTTATGRLASFKPNIQNQPKEARVLYVPDTDKMCFVQADYKSAELYVLAGASGDRKLRADLDNPRKGGMHQLNADRLTEQRGASVDRDTAKNVTYASQYLASPSKMSEMILVGTPEHVYIEPGECKIVADGIWSYYTDASAYKAHLVAMCESKMYITNAFGRTRCFHAGRAPAAVDFIPQSTVADILWCVLKDVAVMAKKYKGRLVTTVHDSIVICVPKKYRKKAARAMKAIMERKFDCVAPGFFIPVEIELGEPGAPWSALTKWEAA